ncbi:MAG TPA: membrane protein insertion efficiency factor YidD [bacterium]|nr:membrane protein insertion efficiency factor YidD [bacterium]
MLNRITIYCVDSLGLAFLLVICLTAQSVFGAASHPIGQEGARCGQSKATACCHLIRFYQKFISPIDATSCRMYPSCSAFASEAFMRHGFLRGMLLTSDRLMRDCLFADSNYTLVKRGGRWLLCDTVEENTWWWSRLRGKQDVRRAK